MFVKVLSHSAGAVSEENERTAIYECNSIFIRAWENEKGEKVKGMKCVILEENKGKICTTIAELVSGNDRIYIMNNKGETIDRLIG